jgi:hypothetical protein
MGGPARRRRRTGCGGGGWARKIGPATAAVRGGRAGCGDGGVGRSLPTRCDSDQLGRRRAPGRADSARRRRAGLLLFSLCWAACQPECRARPAARIRHWHGAGPRARVTVPRPPALNLGRRLPRPRPQAAPGPGPSRESDSDWHGRVRCEFQSDGHGDSIFNVTPPARAWPVRVRLRPPPAASGTGTRPGAASRTQIVPRLPLQRYPLFAQQQERVR